MTLTISNYTGDGVLTDRIDADIVLPHSGGAVVVSGTVQHAGGAQVAITGGPVTLTIPGTGSNFYILQVDYTSGALSSKLSTSAYPAPDAGNLQVFQLTLASTANSNLTLDGATAVTPDN